MYIQCYHCKGVVDHESYVRNCDKKACANSNCDTGNPRPYDIVANDTNGKLVYVSFSDDNITEFNVAHKGDDDVFCFVSITEDENGKAEGCLERGRWDESFTRINMKEAPWYVPGSQRAEEHKVRFNLPEDRRPDWRSDPRRAEHRNPEHKHTSYRSDPSDPRSSRTPRESSRHGESRRTYSRYTYEEYVYPDDYRSSSSRRDGHRRR